MIKNYLPLIFAGLFIATGAPLGAQTVYLNETFDNGDVLGNSPSESGTLGSQRNTSLVTVANGNGIIGTDQYANFNDPDSFTLSGDLEYNVGSFIAIGNLYAQFEFLNPLGSNGSGGGINQFFFGIGNYSTASGARLNSNANRSFAVQLSQSGTTSTVMLKGNAGIDVATGTYNMDGLNTIKFFANDHDTNTLDYTRPDTGLTGTLAANSAVVYLNDTLIGVETSAGFSMNTNGSGFGVTNGDETLGRIGFYSSSGETPNFLIDNLYVSSVQVVPEPSAVSLVLVGGLILISRLRRKARLL